SRRKAKPGTVGPERDVQIPARPRRGGARADDVAVAVGGAAGRRRQIPIEDGELDESVEQPQRLVVGDMLLCLRRQDVGQKQMGGGIGHGRSQNVSVTVLGMPRPIRAESWKMRTVSVSPDPSGAPQSADCWAARSEERPCREGV